MTPDDTEPTAVEPTPVIPPLAMIGDPDAVVCDDNGCALPSPDPSANERPAD